MIPSKSAMGADKKGKAQSKSANTKTIVMYFLFILKQLYKLLYNNLKGYIIFF
jgi:hypothetical protein